MQCNELEHLPLTLHYWDGNRILWDSSRNGSGSHRILEVYARKAEKVYCALIGCQKQEYLGAFIASF